jgi:hypothetical protein
MLDGVALNASVGADGAGAGAGDGAGAGVEVAGGPIVGDETATSVLVGEPFGELQAVVVSVRVRITNLVIICIE